MPGPNPEPELEPKPEPEPEPVPEPEPEPEPELELRARSLSGELDVEELQAAFALVKEKAIEAMREEAAHAKNIERLKKAAKLAAVEVRRRTPRALTPNTLPRLTLVFAARATLSHTRQVQAAAEEDRLAKAAEVEAEAEAEAAKAVKAEEERAAKRQAAEAKVAKDAERVARQRAEEEAKLAKLMSRQKAQSK